MIVGVLGFMSSGKGTVGEILAEEMGFVPLSFAGSLKDAVSAIFGWDRSLLEGDTKESREFRETPDPFWTKKFYDESKFGDSIIQITPRYILQQFGTEVCRNNLLDSIWVDSLERKILQYENVVITDVRFNNEIEFLKGLGSTLIQVNRDISMPYWYDIYSIEDTEYFEDYANKQGIHRSEYEWLGNPNIDHIIENNGSFRDLELRVFDIISNNK